MHDVPYLYKEYRHWILGAALGLVVSIGASLFWWGYRSYRTTIEQQAQLALVTQMELVERARGHAETTAAMWEDIAGQLQRAYEAHASSSLAPFFKVYRADALIHAAQALQASEQGAQHDSSAQLQRAALAELEHAVRELRKQKNTYYYLYAMKYAALLLDMGDLDNPASHEQGKRLLLDCAQDAQNPCSAMAWYYLWEYANDVRDAELLAMVTPKMRANTLLASLLPHHETMPLSGDSGI
jgi:hypothetical protein